MADLGYHVVDPVGEAAMADLSASENLYTRTKESAVPLDPISYVLVKIKTKHWILVFIPLEGFPNDDFTCLPDSALNGTLLYLLPLKVHV